MDEHEHNGTATGAWKASFPRVVADPQTTRAKAALARMQRDLSTPNERLVWEWLRDRRMLGMKWRRQQVIVGFVADFYCPRHRLALEIDGSVHDCVDAQAYDRDRDRIFAAHGITTIRVSNESCTRRTLFALLKQHISLTRQPSSQRPSRRAAT